MKPERVIEAAGHEVLEARIVQDADRLDHADPLPVTCLLEVTAVLGSDPSRQLDLGCGEQRAYRSRSDAGGPDGRALPEACSGISGLAMLPSRSTSFCHCSAPRPAET